MSKFIDAPIGAIPKEFEKQNISDIVESCTNRVSTIGVESPYNSNVVPEQDELLSGSTFQAFLKSLEIEGSCSGRRFTGTRSYYYQDEINVIYALFVGLEDDDKKDIFEKALSALDIVISKISPMNKQFIIFATATDTPMAEYICEKLIRARRKELVIRGVTISFVPVESVCSGEPVFWVSGAYYQPKKRNTKWHCHNEFVPIPAYLEKWIQERVGDAMDEHVNVGLLVPVVLQLFKVGTPALHPNDDTSEIIATRILFRLVGECISFKKIRTDGYLGSFLYTKNFSATIVRLLFGYDKPEYRALFDEWLGDINISPQEIMRRIEEIDEKQQNDTTTGTLLENLGKVENSILACLADIKVFQMLGESEFEAIGMNSHRAKKITEKLDSIQTLIENATGGMESISKKINGTINK